MVASPPRGFGRTGRIIAKPLFVHDDKRPQTGPPREIKKEHTRMSILEKLASIIGALLFITLVIVVGLAFVDYIQSGHEKTVRGGSPRRSLP